MAFPKNSYANFYNKVRRLLREGYIAEVDGAGLNGILLQLTKKGFNFLKSDLNQLREERFAPQSVNHDYWATAVQLGDLIFGIPSGIKFFTEQEFHCTDDSNLPEWVPKSRSHVPDGFTSVQGSGGSRVIAFEVDLNIKEMLRYDKAGFYFDAGLSKFDVVLWVCGNSWILNRIKERLQGLKLRNIDIHQFMLTSDFRKDGWEAKIVHGSLAGQTIREIHLLQPRCKPVVNPLQPPCKRATDIFFPKTKTQRSIKR